MDAERPVSGPRFRVGHRVTYPRSRARVGSRLCCRGVVAGAPIVDEFTGVTWVPVRGDGRAPEDVEWVRADEFVDVAAAGAGDRPIR